MRVEFLAVVMLLAAFPVSAQQGVVSDCDDAAKWKGGTLDTAHVKQGKASIRWAHGEAAQLSTTDIPHDWSAFNSLSLWLCSEKATKSRFMVILWSDDPKTEGPDYYAAAIVLDFTGWRRFQFPFKELGESRRPLGWNQIQGLTFTASGWNNTPHPEAVVYVDDIVLTKEAALKGPRISDEEFFQSLDLDQPALAGVKAAAQKGDWAAAKTAFVRHLKERQTPRWFFDWRARPQGAIPPSGGSDGWDYFARAIPIDWAGWKRFSLKKSDFGKARQPIGWNWIRSITFTASGFDLTPNPGLTLWFDDAKLAGNPPRRIGDFSKEDSGWSGVTRADDPAKPGRPVSKWENMHLTSRVSLACEVRDWTDADALEFSIYSEKPTANKVMLLLDSDRPDTRAADKVCEHELSSCGVPHQFGKDIDWTLQPIDYNEWPWQLNRHPFWGTLASAYWDTGDEKFAKEYVAQITHWIETCPVPKDKSGNHARSAWRTIETGIRMGGIWPACFYRFLSSPSFTDDAVVMVVKSMVEHARHLMRWPTGANWLAMEGNGLFHVGVLFPEFKDAAEWRKTAIERLYKELDNQVYPDGAQMELAPGYHGVSLHNFVGTLEMAKLNEVALPADYATKLERMYEYYALVSLPNGTMPALNDSGWGSVRNWCAQGFKYFPHRLDFQHIATAGAKGERPKVTSHSFPYAGQIAMRTGWQPDDLYLLIEVGPFGLAHQHEDKLSFIIHAYGKTLLTEGGVYAYDSSQWRRYILSTRSHNTVMVDGMEQNRRSQPRDTFVVKKPLEGQYSLGEDFDYAWGVYNEGYGPKNDRSVTHTRKVLFVKPEFWLVTDFLTAADDREHRYESLFHFDTDLAEADAATKSVATRIPDGPNLAIVPLATDGLDVSIVKGQEKPVVQGWLPAGGFKCRPIAAPVFTKSGKGTTVMAYALYPMPARQPPAGSEPAGGFALPIVKAEPLPVTSNGSPASDAFAAKLTFRDSRVSFFVQALERNPVSSRNRVSAARTLEFGQFATDGEAAFVELDPRGKPTRTIVANGSFARLRP